MTEELTKSELEYYIEKDRLNPQVNLVWDYSFRKYTDSVEYAMFLPECPTPGPIMFSFLEDKDGRNY